MTVYLSGVVRPECLRRSDLGLMLTPFMGNRPDLTDTIWAADTGCFTQPDRHDDRKYLRWLEERKEFRRQCCFATAPDVVGNAEETLSRSLPMLTDIRKLGFPAALVAQNGLEKLRVPWDEFDALFIGGTTEWKLGGAAYRLAQEASDRGKWAHCGRVNSLKRFRWTFICDYDSADGTFLAFGPDKNLPRLEAWLTQIKMRDFMDGWCSL